jgi:hypothetical protein
MNNFLNCTDIQFSLELELKNPGIDSTFESLMNFKRDLHLP